MSTLFLNYFVFLVTLQSGKTCVEFTPCS